MIITEAVILAGGMGTRLKSLVNDRPKPMALINERPFLEYLMDYLSGQGIRRIILSAGYRHEVISDHFGSRYKDMDLAYAIEDEPLGTGGGVKFALGFVAGDPVFIVNGDTFFPVDLHLLAEKFSRDEADLVIALHPEESGSRYGTIITNENGRILSFTEKSNQAGTTLINGGIYLAKSDILDSPELPKIFSLEKDFLERFCGTMRFFGVIAHNEFIDIGIPETYMQAGSFLEKSGRP